MVENPAGPPSGELVNLGTEAYPWNNILLQGNLQFYSSEGLATQFHYNTTDKCIDVLFT
jgi:hypothetical protein